MQSFETFFKSRIALVVALAGIATTSHAQTLTAIDFTGNVSATDKDWFYRNADGSSRPNGGGVHPPVEILTGRSDVKGVVYQLGATIGIRFRLRNDSRATFKGTFAIKGATLGGGTFQNSVNLGGQGSKSISIAPGTTIEVAYSLSKAPSTLNVGKLSLDFAVVDANGKTVFSTKGPTPVVDFGTVLSAPIAPMNVPWTNLVYVGNVCGAGSSSADYVTKGIDLNVNRNLGIQYSDGGATIWTVPSTGKFRLSAFIKASKRNANCTDVANLVSLINRSIGISATPIQLRANGPSAFRTNPICLIGADANDPANYKSTDWQYHQVALLSDGVHDACGSFYFDLSGRLYGYPAAGWPINDYWQKKAGTYFLGLVDGPKGSRTSSPVARSTQNAPFSGVQ